MARNTTNIDTILDRVRDRVIDQVANANSSTCFISDDPDSKPPNPGDFWYVVSPDPNFQFTELFDGGGTNQAEVSTYVYVTIHSSHQNDEAGRAENFFTHTTRGILPEARLVLKALSGHDLDDGATSPNQILNELMHPSSGSWVRPDRSSGSIQLAFHIRFDMDLTS